MKINAQMTDSGLIIHNFEELVNELIPFVRKHFKKKLKTKRLKRKYVKEFILLSIENYLSREMIND
jgi:hypothetical protein